MITLSLEERKRFADYLTEQTLLTAAEHQKTDDPEAKKRLSIDCAAFSIVINKLDPFGVNDGSKGN